ncbi:MAG: carbohydrate binding family 9 domain-containing protein [Bacteroidetes bacterium]|nr:carbohydrate binding family 9 domain-containing protein [Bacteroidota bacterium]
MKTQMNISKIQIIFNLIMILLVSNTSLIANVFENNLKDIKIDGMLTEQIWLNAKKFTNLIQIEPNIFAPSAVRSEFNFTYDTENLYIGGKIYQDKNTIAANNARKDDSKTIKSDYIAVGIDPLNNGNSAYLFIINPVNAQGDGTIDLVGNPDYSWDAIFVSETQILDNYWTFELKIPLTSINFQNKDVQTWGVMFCRYYANEQELSINQLLDKNTPFRVSDFYKIDDIKGIKKSKKIAITPYLYSFGDYNKLKDSLSFDGKIGGEIKYNPTPSSTILATFNPDFAQVETDKEIINVSDLPTTYPEKRPFFTESNDMYPGLAVNTRNILDINAGLKFKRIGKFLKIDLTTIYDKDENIWGLGNLRITDNKKYHLEIISGIKNAKTDYLKDYDYNVTVHGKLYFFNQQMQVYTWYGTINMPNGQANEFESVNALKWISRTWNAGVWNQFKSELYNPNIVGFPALSNEIIIESWLGYTFYNENGLFRKTSFRSHLRYFDLYANRGNGYVVNINQIKNQLFLGNSIGNWDIRIEYSPNITQKFRFRSQDQFNDNKVFTDAISDFVLIEQSSHTFNFNFTTDASKKIGAEFNFNNALVRKSKANNFSLESFVKIDSKVIIAYSYNFIDIDGSDYQNKYKQTIHRLKAEYNINDKINMRFIYQPNRIEIPSDEYLNQDYICNLTFSWEYMPGGNFYLVYNKLRNYDKYTNDPKNFIDNNHSLIVKISKTF